MKYLIATLGCKVNQFETQAMEERLQQVMQDIWERKVSMGQSSIQKPLVVRSMRSIAADMYLSETRRHERLMTGFNFHFKV